MFSEQETAHQLGREAASLEETGTACALLHVGRPRGAEALVVDSGKPLQPPLWLIVEMRLDQVIREPFAAQLIANSQRPEALREPLGNIAFGKPRLTEEPFGAQPIEHGVHRLGGKAPRDELAVQLQTAVIAAREQAERAILGVRIQGQASAISAGSALPTVCGRSCSRMRRSISAARVGLSRK